MDKKIFDKIIEFGKKYVTEYIEKEYNKNTILNDAYESLVFFLDHIFLQGRKDDISKLIVIEAKTVLEKKKANFSLSILKSELNGILNDLHEVIGREMNKAGKSKAGRERDYDMIVDFFNYLLGKKTRKVGRKNYLTETSTKEKNNLIKYIYEKIGNGKIDEAYTELISIHSIDKKIASFCLRDIIFMFSDELETKIGKDDYAFLQPVDTWVEQVADKVGIKGKSKKETSEKIIEVCINQTESPLLFNAGSWYIGKNSFDIIIKNLDHINV